MSDSLRPRGQQPIRFLCPWNSPGKSTGVGCHFLLQGIFLTQGFNSGLLHCRQTLYHLSHQGSPKDIFSLFMLYQLHCSQTCRILKDLLKSHFKLLIPVVVHLKTAYQLRLFKDCISSFPHNVFQFPRYIMPYLENRLTFFFFPFSSTTQLTLFSIPGMCSTLLV